MLHRKDSEGLILISQPAHSWLSGQIARHWGGDVFEPLSEEVCLAAEQHDIGFLDWEAAPTLNPETGLPHDFLNMPPRQHLELWTTGIRHMLRFGRYPALLVSLHFTNICRQNWVSRKKDGLVREYLEEQETLQRTILTSLQNDFHYGTTVTEEIVTRDQQLVSTLDWLSLIACLNHGHEKTIMEVPSRGGKVSIKVSPNGADGKSLRLEPWPLSVPKLQLVCEGRRLMKTFASEEAMREAIKAAARITLVTELYP